MLPIFCDVNRLKQQHNKHYCEWLKCTNIMALIEVTRKFMEADVTATLTMRYSFIKTFDKTANWIQKITVWKVCTKRGIIDTDQTWAAVGFFPGMGSEGVWRTEVLQRGSREDTRWGFRGEALRRWRHFLKLMHKFFVYWQFRQHLQRKKHFTTFPGEASAPPTFPCLRAPMR